MSKITEPSPSPFRKGDKVKDAEGHVGEVVSVYPAQLKARVRWHRGFATEERFGMIEKVDLAKTRLKVRLRERVQASPPRGMRQNWSEYQVIDGRRVVSRHDFEEDADAWIVKNGADYPAAEVTP